MAAPSPRSLPPAVWALGAVSFLTDAASEMIVPLLPVFLAGLGGGALALGAVEGVAGAVASVLKLLAGRWSDRLGRSLPFVLAGYGLSAAVRPLVALAAAPWHVVAVRATDRIGKGLRGSPRDAILARAVAPEARGAAFGVHRALDHAGAAVGPLLAVALLATVTRDVRAVFWAAAVPGALSVAVILLFVREPPAPDPGRSAPGRAGGTASNVERRRRGRLGAFLVAYGCYALAAVSELFLLLRLGTGGRPLPLVGYPVAWFSMHVVKTAAAALGGALSDRVGRRAVLSSAWIAMAASYLALGVFEAGWGVWAALAIFSVQAGAVDGVQRAWVADVVPRARLGSGYGWFHFVEGFLALAASLWFGWVWEGYGAPAAFTVAAGLALAAVAALWLVPGVVPARCGSSVR